MAVFSGMLGVTLFGIFLTPVFYYSIRRRYRPSKPVPQEKPAPQDLNGAGWEGQ